MFRLLFILALNGFGAGLAWAGDSDLMVSAPASLEGVISGSAEAWTKRTGIAVKFEFLDLDQQKIEIQKNPQKFDLLVVADQLPKELLAQGILLPPTVRTFYVRPKDTSFMPHGAAEAPPQVYAGAVLKAGAHPKFGSAFLDYLTSHFTLATRPPAKKSG